MKKISIIIIDDHTLIRQTWSFILNNHPGFSVLAESGNAEEGIELCKQLKPEIVMMDINLPGISGLEAVPLIRKYAPATKVIGVSMHSQPAYAKKMMQSGASGYITKSSSQQEMLQALLDIHDGKKYVCGEIKNALAKEMIQGDDIQNGIDKLSLREIEVIKMVREGLSSKEIAKATSISVKTVEVHRYNILRKLNLRNAAALVDYINKKACGFI
ncbi:MAG TPA: response regulator transcription factor [Flavisolibacter sp.]|jgi:DNA-binding NarL/FixJ family response regulator|nr:response regulator transcription factor [Flavisolibacter sp.]